MGKRGRPSKDFRKLIRTSKEQRVRNADFKEYKLIASVSNMKLRRGTNCISDLNALTEKIAKSCKERKLVLLFRKSIFKLLGGQASPLLIDESYANLKKSWFELLSYAFINQKHFSNKFDSYELLTEDLLNLLPIIDGLLIISFFLEPYSYCDSLVDAIYIATGGHFSKRQTELYLDEINLKAKDSVTRFIITLILLATQRKIPSWWWGIFRSCKRNYDESKADPKTKAINSLLNKVSLMQEQNSTLREQLYKQTQINENYADKCASLTKKCEDLEAKNEILTKRYEAKQKQVFDLQKQNDELRACLEEANLVEWW